MTEQSTQDPNVTNPTSQAAPAQTQTPPAPPATPAEAVKTGAKWTDDDLERIVKERLKREKEAEKKAIEAAAAKAAEETAAKQGEWQKVAETREKELAEIRAELAKRDRSALQLKVAKAIGIPESLASRLIGETEKDLEADAKTLLETLPKPAPTPTTPEPKPRQPGIVPANPGANGQQGETLAQQRERIYGARPNPFDPTTAAQHGGGAFFRGDRGGGKE